MIDAMWDGIAAYCQPENKVSLGFVEGLNNKIRVIQRRAYGLKRRGLLPPQSSHLHVAGAIAGPLGRSVPDTLDHAVVLAANQGRFAPLKRWPEGGPSLTAAARAGKSRRVRSGRKDGARSNKMDWTEED